MGIVKIIGISLSALMVIILLRKLGNDYAVLASCALNIAITFFSLSILIPVFEYIDTLTDTVGTGNLCTVMFKSTGVCLLCSTASEICRDSGEGSLSQRIELAGKCTLCAFSLPLIKQVFDYAVSFIS